MSRRDHGEDLDDVLGGNNAFITDILTCSSEEESEAQPTQQQRINDEIEDGSSQLLVTPTPTADYNNNFNNSRNGRKNSGDDFVEQSANSRKRRSSYQHQYNDWRGFITRAKWSRLSRKQKGAAICSLVIIAVTVVFLICYLVVVPQVISDYASQARFTFVNVTMTDPGVSSLRLMCAAEVTVDMPIAAHCDQTAAAIYFQGQEVGTFGFDHFEFPKGNHTTLITNWDTLQITNLTLFSELSKKMLMEKSSVWTLKMVTTVWADLGRGFSIPFHGIHISTDVVVPGMGGLTDVELVKYDVVLDKKGNAMTYVAMKITDRCVINVIPVGTITMDASVLGSREATLQVSGANLVTGPNIIIGVGPVDVSNQTVLNYVFYQYLNGHNTTIESVITECSVPLYNYIFKGFKMSYVLQGNDAKKSPLVVAALMEVDLKTIIEGLRKFTLVIPAQLYLHYQFSAPIVFTDFELDVTYKGVSLGGYHGPMTPPLEVPGNSYFLTRIVPITADLRRTNVKKFLIAIGEELAKGITHLGLKGSFSFRVGNVAASTSTEQPPVPTCHPSTRALCKIPDNIQ